MSTDDLQTASGGAVGAAQPAARGRMWARLMAFLDRAAAATSKHEADWLDRVKFLKTALQMIIGCLMTCVLIAKASVRVCNMMEWHSAFPGPLTFELLKAPTLTVVGRSLAYSAGVELAYMLFTPGPDEAINPVVVGLAASILIIISGDKVSYQGSLAVAVACLAIWLLLFIKNRFSAELKE